MSTSAKGSGTEPPALQGAGASAPARWAVRGLSLAAALLLIVMMLVTFVDVIGRYLFNAPLPGAFELTEVLLALVIFVGLPIVTARREHVTVDLFTSRLPHRLRAVLARAASLVTAVMLVLFTWRLGVSARDYTSYGDATVYLGIPLGPVAGLMAVFCGFAALVALWLAFRPGRGD